MSEFIELTDANTKRKLLIAKSAIVLVESEYRECGHTFPKRHNARIQTSMDGWIVVAETLNEISALLQQ